jgi:hypothetical protein
MTVALHVTKQLLFDLRNNIHLAFSPGIANLTADVENVKTFKLNDHSLVDGHE